MSLLLNHPFLAPPPPCFHQKTDKNKSKGLITAATSCSSISSTNYRYRVRVRCCTSSNSNNRGGGGGEETSGCPYKILGLDPTTTTSPSFPSLLKAAFRSRVKEFHPDVCKDVSMDADAIIQRVILAYEVVSTHACKEHLMPSHLLPKMVQHVQLPKGTVMITQSNLLLDSAQRDASILSHHLKELFLRIYLTVYYQIPTIWVMLPCWNLLSLKQCSRTTDIRNLKGSPRVQLSTSIGADIMRTLAGQHVQKQKM